MTCGYCGGLNSTLDHRCGRCGRRLYEPSEAGPISQNALALSWAPEAAEPTVSEDGPEQGALFTVPAETPRARVYEMPRRQAPVIAARSYRRQPQTEGARQQRFSFQQVAVPKTVDSRSLDPNAHVADVIDRLRAASMDGLMVGTASALVLLVIWVAGILPDPFASQNLLKVAGLVVATLTFYRLFWCLVGSETMGMRWAGLKLVNFDKGPATRLDRLRRMGASYISASAAGLGLVWALVDEERLTWHDLMSRTFPSPAGRSGQPNRTGYPTGPTAR